MHAHAEDGDYGSPADGESLYNSEEKLFEDIKANQGDKAFIFIHTVPYEGSVALVNLLTSTRLVRKGFDVSIVLYGPGCCSHRAPVGTRVSGRRRSQGTSRSTSSSRRS